MRDVIVWAVGVCLLAVAAPPTQAELITIQIEGVVDTVEDDGDYLQDQIHVGDIITGWYTYDTDTPDTNPFEEIGDYEHSDAPSGIFLTLSGYEFATAIDNVNFLVEIIDNYTSGGLYDAYVLRSYNNMALSSGVAVDHISWQLGDDSAMALSSTALPEVAPAIADWGSRNALRLHGERGGYIIDGHVTFTIPEPCTILLLGTGLFAIVRRIH